MKILSERQTNLSTKIQETIPTSVIRFPRIAVEGQADQIVCSAMSAQTKHPPPLVDEFKVHRQFTRTATRFRGRKSRSCMMHQSRNHVSGLALTTDLNIMPDISPEPAALGSTTSANTEPEQGTSGSTLEPGAIINRSARPSSRRHRLVLMRYRHQAQPPGVHTRLELQQ